MAEGRKNAPYIAGFFSKHLEKLDSKKKLSV